MKQFIDAQTLIGVLDSGNTRTQLTDELQKTLEAMHDHAGDRPKAKAKGTVNLKLSLTLEGGMVTIEADVDSKRPKPVNGQTRYWLTEDMRLSTEHPKQTDMFNSPREVASN